MKDLIHIKDLVDEALENLTQGQQYTIRNTIIVLRRLRPKWLTYFEDFQSLLKTIERRDPKCYFYARYMSYLRKYLNADPWYSLSNYLSSKGYTEYRISFLRIEYDEGAFFNRLSKNTSYLFISLFYLYRPALTEKFIKLELLHYLTAEEDDMILNYRKLSPDYQAKASSYIEELVQKSELQKIKKD